MSTNFPDFFHMMGFVALSCAMGNWWGNACISRMMKYTTGWGSSWKNHPYYGKVWEPISEAFLIQWGLLHFPMLWEIDEKIHVFPMWCSIPWYGNKTAPCYGKSTSTNFPGYPYTIGFVAFSRAMGNWWGNFSISHMKSTTGLESNWNKHPCYEKCIGTNFPDFHYLMCFATFSHAMGNWVGNLCITHVMKYTVGWESNGKKAPILCGKHEYQFLRFYDEFCSIFLYHEKLMGKPIHFLYDETR